MPTGDPFESALPPSGQAVQLGKLSTGHPRPTLTACNHSNSAEGTPVTAETRKPAYGARCKQGQATKQCPKQCPLDWKLRHELANFLEGFFGCHGKASLFSKYSERLRPVFRGRC